MEIVRACPVAATGALSPGGSGPRADAPRCRHLEPPTPLKVDFAPPVKQLDAQGYVLKGGRVDVVNARTAAVLVYQAGRHTVEVFIWPANRENGIRLPGGAAQRLQPATLGGGGGLEIWCISDMGAEELDTFARRWRAAS